MFHHFSFIVLSVFIYLFMYMIGCVYFYLYCNSDDEHDVEGHKLKCTIKQSVAEALTSSDYTFLHASWK